MLAVLMCSIIISLHIDVIVFGLFTRQVFGLVQVAQSAKRKSMPLDHDGTLGTCSLADLDKIRCPELRGVLARAGVRTTKEWRRQRLLSKAKELWTASRQEHAETMEHSYEGCTDFIFVL